MLVLADEDTESAPRVGQVPIAPRLVCAREHAARLFLGNANRVAAILVAEPLNQQRRAGRPPRAELATRRVDGFRSGDAHVLRARHFPLQLRSHAVTHELRDQLLASSAAGCARLRGRGDDRIGVSIRW